MAANYNESDEEYGYECKAMSELRTNLLLMAAKNQTGCQNQSSK